MTHRGHTVGGAIAGLIAVKVIGIAGVLNIPLFLLSILAGLVPDIDHKGSWIAHRMPIMNEMYKQGINNALTRKLFGKQRMENLVGHRTGLTHTLLGALFSSLLAGALFSFLIYTLVRYGLLPVHLLKIPGDSWLLWTVPLWQFMPFAIMFALAWLLGYLSHILLDMLTYSGVAVFFPWTRERYGIGPQEFRHRMKKWGVSDG